MTTLCFILWDRLGPDDPWDMVAVYESEAAAELRRDFLQFRNPPTSVAQFKVTQAPFIAKE